MKTADDENFSQDPFRQLDPRTREEVGGILERAFRQENGRITQEIEIQQILVLSNETEIKAQEVEGLVHEALEAAGLAEERYKSSHSLEDLETMQRWQAEAAGYRRQAERLRLEVEQLRKYLPG